MNGSGNDDFLKMVAQNVTREDPHTLLKQSVRTNVALSQQCE